MTERYISNYDIEYPPFSKNHDSTMPEGSKAPETTGSSTGLSATPNYYFKVPTIQADDISKLEGQENYEEWAAEVSMVLEAIGALNIVCDGQELDDGASEDEKHYFKAIHSQARLLLVQSVEKEIKPSIIKIKSCHDIWTYLSTAFYRDTAIDAIGQMKTVFSSIGEKFDPSQAIGTFISLFETEWTSLSSLTSTATSDYFKLFQKLLSSDEFKRDILLTHLIHHIPQIVDNITLREYKTFVEVKKKLLSTSLSTQQESAFYTGNNNKQNTKKPKSDAKNAKDTKDKTCTWCANHHPRIQKGHL